MVYACEHCQKTCVSSRGLSQHIRRTPYCNEKQAEKLGSGSSTVNSRALESDPEPQPAVHRPSKRQKAGLGDYCAPASASGSMVVTDVGFDLAAFPGDDPTEWDDEATSDSHQLTESDVENLHSGDEDTEAEDELAEAPPNVEMLEAFREHCEYGVRQMQPLDEHTVIRWWMPVER